MSSSAHPGTPPETDPADSGPASWDERFRIRSYEVEPDGRLRIVVLARMLQETAWQHASRLGWGLVNRGVGELFWVLSRLRMRIDRYPVWGEELTIRTWPVGTEKILAVRDFALLDSAGDTMGQATSGWLMVDGSTGRPTRPAPLLEGVTVSPSQYDGDLARLPALADGELSDPAPARYHDIDQYRHVNNTAYLEWMIDAVADGADLPEIRRLGIDFIKETLLGEPYQVRRAGDGAAMRCEVVRAVRDTGGSEVACRAVITWAQAPPGPP